MCPRPPSGVGASRLTPRGCSPSTPQGGSLCPAQVRHCYRLRPVAILSKSTAQPAFLPRLWRGSPVLPPLTSWLHRAARCPVSKGLAASPLKNCCLSLALAGVSRSFSSLDSLAPALPMSLIRRGATLPHSGQFQLVYLRQSNQHSRNFHVRHHL